MNKEQKRIAANTVAAAIRDALDGKDRPTAKQLKALARDIAAAIAAGIKKLNECS